MPAPSQEEVHNASSGRKLVIEIEPHVIDGFAEIRPEPVQFLNFLLAIAPCCIEFFERVLIFLHQLALDKSLQFFQREAAVVCRKSCRRGGCTGTTEAASLVFLSAAARARIISADL